ncbi:ABC transporter permease [Nonomuraea muscovyensis]|uniref:Peptide/nickel transport system permease protein n=1 Tax=Nonomuraea muscovyensis TaxID=1124761 RepID=A0A7X0CAA2_9ACTN|nr:ABC transporter permease [Nonomuraea muscovyensis]MBB6349961.1 peptide/nickel transport system permease protein [Nonomuraea muscovyensis]
MRLRRAATLLAAMVARGLTLLAAASVMIFLAAEALPGDAAEVRFGGRATPEQVAQIREAGGLDRPPHARYLDWLAGTLAGRPGHSYVTGRPVADLISERAPVTLLLAGAALALACPAMPALAWLAVRGPRRLRPVITVLVVGGAALPQVVVAAGLVALLSAAWGLVPPVSLLPAGAAPWQHPHLLVLPVLTLALPSAAYGAALLRGVFADVAALPFVRDAELRGLSSLAVLLRYVLPMSAAPLARLLAVISGGLVAGTAVAETLFGLAGLGELLVTAVGVRDIPVVQAVALLATAVVVCGLLAADGIARVTTGARA